MTITNLGTAIDEALGADPSYVKAPWVSDYLDVSTARIYALCREGILPHCKVGRSLRFDPVRIKAWAAGGGSGYPGGWRKDGV